MAEMAAAGGPAASAPNTTGSVTPLRAFVDEPAGARVTRQTNGCVNELKKTRLPSAEAPANEAKDAPPLGVERAGRDQRSAPPPPTS